MHKLFLGVASIIVTHFLQKAYRKITEKPTIDKEEIYRQMKKAEYDARRAAARPIVAKMEHISTPRSYDAWLTNIATVGEMAAQYKENIPAPKEPCDHAALRPRGDMGLRAWGGSCDGAAMGRLS